MSAEKERILREIKAGRPMVVGQGGSVIRPAGEPVANGATVKKHTWGA